MFPEEKSTRTILIVRELTKWIKLVLSNLRIRGSFGQNFSFLFGGKVLAIILSLVVTPILTRTYSPATYGHFALFNAIAMNFTVLSCLAYDSSLIIVKDEKRFFNLVVICIVSTTICLTLLLAGLYLFRWFYISSNHQAGSSELINHNFIQLTCVGSLVYVALNVQSNWNIRRKRFKLAALNGVLIQMTNRFVALILGFFLGAPLVGLVAAEIAGKLVGLGLYFKVNFINEFKNFKSYVSLQTIGRTLKDLRGYPLFILPSKYLNLIANQSLVFLFSLQYGTTVLGSYSLAVSVLHLPIQLLKNALSPVLLDKVSSLSNDVYQLNSFVKKLFLIVTLCSVPVFLSLIIGAELFFPMIFGKDWRLSGDIASIMAVYLIVELVDMFSIPIFQVFNVEKEILKTQIFRFVLTGMGMIPGLILDDYTVLLLGYGFMFFLYGLYSTQKAFKIIKLKIYSHIIVLFLLLFAAYFLKEGIS